VELALLGNCSYQALIDKQANVVWLCWPRFDSSFVFGSLLDEQYGGEFSIKPKGTILDTKQQYEPNTNILSTMFETEQGSFEVTDFAPRFRQYERFFKPMMLIRKLQPLQGRPLVRVMCRPTYDYGRLDPDEYLASNHIQWKLPVGQMRLTTNAPLSYVREGRYFVLDRPIYLVMTYGQPLEAELEETCEIFLHRTRKYWQTWVKHNSIPHHFQQEVIRSALVLKLHQFEDTGAITAAATTSLPEHPGAGRNWDYRFCWLRDACFTLGALRRLGQFEEMEAFVGYLTNIAEQSHDRLQPCYGIAGEKELFEITLDHLKGYQGNVPVRAGNQAYEQLQHDVYGEMISAIAPLFLDYRFSGSNFPRSTNMIHRLLEHIRKTMTSPDVSLWEKRQGPQVHTFTLLLHWLGASMATRIGQFCADPDLENQAKTLANKARQLIETQCWRPELGYYADAVVGDYADASLLMMVNLGFLNPTDPKTVTHVEELAKRLADPHRDYLLYRYQHNDGIGETKSTFTVCGFWYSEALARIGKCDQAFHVLQNLLSHANHVGLFSEDIDPISGQLWGNFPQTYSHVGLINAAFALNELHGPSL
jgi:GH15 family glucan-1,4-alpha-glucosidase